MTKRSLTRLLRARDTNDRHQPSRRLTSHVLITEPHRQKAADVAAGAHAVHEWRVPGSEFPSIGQLNWQQKRRGGIMRAARWVLACSTVFCLIVPDRAGAGAESASSSSGEEVGYVRSSATDMTLSLPGGTVAVQFYESIRGSSPSEAAKGTQKFAFSPYFLFLTSPRGTESKPYRLTPNPDGTENVTLRLLLYDDRLKQAAASWVSAYAEQYVKVTDVQVLPIWNVFITERGTGLQVILPDGPVTPSTRVSAQTERDITFLNLSPERARNLVQKIENGSASFTFDYSYTKAGTVLSDVEVKYNDVASSSEFQNVTGGGGSALVSRDGAARVARGVASSLSVWSFIEGQDEKSNLTEDLLNLFLDKLKFKEAIDFTSAENFNRVAALSIDPKGADFEAQRIKRLH